MPEGITMGGLRQHRLNVKMSLAPCGPDQIAVALGKIGKFLRDFNVDGFGSSSQERIKGVLEVYRNTFKNLPPDLAVLAADRVIEKHKWSKLPKPQEVSDLVSDELVERRSVLSRIDSVLLLGRDAPSNSRHWKDMTAEQKAEFDKMMKQFKMDASS